jgi:LacI family transcriptional regulator
MVTGFDGSAEASVVEPSLTTVLIPGGEIGRLAASALFERIRYPDAPCLLTYVKTVPVWGGSTR